VDQADPDFLAAFDAQNRPRNRALETPDRGYAAFGAAQLRRSRTRPDDAEAVRLRIRPEGRCDDRASAQNHTSPRDGLTQHTHHFPLVQARENKRDPQNSRRAAMSRLVANFRLAILMVR